MILDPIEHLDRGCEELSRQVCVIGDTSCMLPVALHEGRIFRDDPIQAPCTKPRWKGFTLGSAESLKDERGFVDRSELGFG